MSNKKDDQVYLKHILEAITWIEEYIKNVSREEYLDNHLIQDGVIRQVGIIGEATKHLSTEFKENYGNVSWKDIAGMRDKLIHDYLGVDLEAVWETATRDIPALKATVVSIID